MYCLVTKGSPCRATPYPFKCVGLHVVCKQATEKVQFAFEFAGKRKKKRNAFCCQSKTDSRLLEVKR